MYRILVNYGYDGWNFVGCEETGDEFETAAEALIYAMENSNSFEFLIVKIVKFKEVDS